MYNIKVKKFVSVNFSQIAVKKSLLDLKLTMSNPFREEILRLYGTPENQAIDPEPPVPVSEGDDGECTANCTLIFWIKIIFIVVCFCQGFFTGSIPTWSTTCRTNPKVLGVANAFAAGVFLAIALNHVLPEEIEAWGEYVGAEEVFPLPELLCFLGYTLILILDKVLFDSSALFDSGHDGRDPAVTKLSQKVAEAAERAQNLGPNATEEEIRASKAEARSNIEQTVKEYLDPNERFAERMRRSMTSDKGGDNAVAEQ